MSVYQVHLNLQIMKTIEMWKNISLPDFYVQS